MLNKKYQAIFFGTPEFAVPTLEKIITLPYLDLRLVITQPNKPVGRQQILTAPPIKVLAQKNKLPILQPEKIKTEAFETQFRQLNPEVIILVAYGKIIPKNLLAISKYGWLNLHASLLPKFRGASPIQFAILTGAKDTGVTLMKMDEGMDTGPIIAQEKLAIAPEETSQTLHDKLSRLSAEALEKNLLAYLEGKLKPKPQDNSQATSTKIIEKADGKINWQKPAIEIERQIRAFTPWPGAWCFWPRNQRAEQKELTNSAIEQRLKIIKAKVSSDSVKLPPGQTKKSGESVIVGCGQGNLELQTTQLEGKKEIVTRDFLKGYPEFKNTKLE